MTSKQDIRIIVYREDDVFVAQCLEYDICTQAPDKETLHDRMNCLIEIELEEMGKTGQELDPAPVRFHDMWDGGGPNYKEVAA